MGVRGRKTKDRKIMSSQQLLSQLKLKPHCGKADVTVRLAAKDKFSQILSIRDINASDGKLEKERKVWLLL